VPAGDPPLPLAFHSGREADH